MATHPSSPPRLGRLIKQAALVALSLMPFGVSIFYAYAAWTMVTGIATVWRMVAMTLVWIAAFAVGTQLFWKVTDLLSPTKR